MKKHYYLLPMLALGMAACTQETLSPDQAGNEASNEQIENANGLMETQLAIFNGNPSRVSYEGATRAEEDLKPGELKLIASIANPSKEEGFNFSKEEGGRWMSATCVYYDESDLNYYVTYHMQGNNYHTTLNNDIAGAIQKFSIEGDKVNIKDGFRAAYPETEDFDFNHLYFDDINNRFIAVGHNILKGNSKNTNAIIGLFNPNDGKLSYKTIKTNEKDFDENGKSLGYKDAGDANGVISVYNCPNYFVATRKGLAVLSARENDLFAPALNAEDGSNYFIKTPGSCKFVTRTSELNTGTKFEVLYLAEERDKDEELAYNTSSSANIAQFQTTPGTNEARDHILIDPNAPFDTFYNSFDLNILDYNNQISLGAISPIDGKNAFCVNEGYEYYAPLGTNGLYYRFRGASNGNNIYEGVLKFGNRPVNCVTMDLNQNQEGLGEGYDRTSHYGFIYVANGAKLTILHRRTMEVVANYNIPFLDADGNEVASSANYIHVRTLPKGENGLCERIITVAFGQEGVKIFRFMPETKTVWEKDIPSSVQ